MNEHFTALYERYKQGIFSYAYYLSGDRHTAEEICQDVFLKVYLNAARFDGRSSFKTWIYRIARNTYLDYVGDKKRKALLQAETLDKDLADRRLTPEEHFLNLERGEQIRKALGEIQDQYRTYIILRDMQSLSYREIAGVTGQSLSSVKVGIYRARQAFRAIYARLEGK